jgi:hypothetical protein
MTSASIITACSDANISVFASAITRMDREGCCSGVNVGSSCHRTAFSLSLEL